MRVYLPATVEDLAAPEVSERTVHAVTEAARRVLGDEDDELYELVAFLAAADESVARISQSGVEPRRVVISADVPNSMLEPAGADAIETALVLTSSVPWRLVAAIHVDDGEAAQAVAAAVAGDEQALEDLGERALLWYDPSELSALRSQLP